MTLRVRHRLVERLRQIALIALLFVPIALSGHQHAADQPAQPCAVCVVTQHTPVTYAAAVATPTVVALVTTVEAEPITTPPALAPCAPVGRGPPALPVARTV